MEIVPPTVPPQFGRELAGRFWGSANLVRICSAVRRRKLGGSASRSAADVVAVCCGRANTPDGPPGVEVWEARGREKYGVTKIEQTFGSINVRESFGDSSTQASQPGREAISTPLPFTGTPHPHNLFDLSLLFEG